MYICSVFLWLETEPGIRIWHMIGSNRELLLHFLIEGDHIYFVDGNGFISPI